MTTGARERRPFARRYPRQRESWTPGGCQELARPQAAPDRLAQPPGRGAFQVGHLGG